MGHKKLPASSGIAYYRRKQVDFDDEFSLSNIVSAKFDKLKGQHSWVLYPNPSLSSEKIHLELRVKEDWNDEPILIRITDPKGRKSPDEFNTPQELSNFVTSFFVEKGPGLYFIELIWGDNSEQFKVWKK